MAIGCADMRGVFLRPTVETRQFALNLVQAKTLHGKLLPAPQDLTDRSPGPELRISAPGRPANLTIVSPSRAKVPPLDGMVDPRQRSRILHALANHELQAAELFAWALLAFPDAPATFRSGLLCLVAEEQQHCRMYMARLGEWKVGLGDYPVSGYFWGKVKDITTPQRFVCTMALTFENANLDHAANYGARARELGDEKTARLFERIGKDEVRHVRFGWRWLKRWKQPDETMWEAYRGSVVWPLRPGLARGEVFHPEGRIAVGMDPEFIRRLSESERKPGRALSSGTEGTTLEETSGAD